MTDVRDVTGAPASRLARALTGLRGPGRPAGLLLAAAAVAIVARLVGPSGPPGAVLLLLLNAVVVAAIVIGMRHHRPSARSAWLVLAVTQTLSLGAFTSWYLYPSLTGVVLPVPSPADVLFLLLYTGNCVAVGLLIRRERTGRDRETLLDVLIVTASLAALSWVFLMAPYARAAELSTEVKLLSLAYPALDLVLVVLTLRLAVSGSRTTPAKALLLAWAAFQLAGDTAYGVLALAGRWTLDSHVQLFWMAAFACLGAAALHPSMSTLGAPAPELEQARARTTGQVRRAVVIGAVLVLPLVLTGELLTGDLDDLPVIAGASVLVFLLALARGTTVDGVRDKADRKAFVRLVGSFLVFALLPLGLLTESSIRLSERAVEGDARAAVRATSTVSAELVEQQMTGIGQLVDSYGERQLLRSALGDGTIETFDRSAINRHLTQLQALGPGVAGVFVTDARGRLSDVLPATPSIVGKDFGFRDWYAGALSRDGYYVSEAYQTAISGEARVVAVATAIRRPGTREVLGVLAVAYDLQAVQEFADSLSAAQGVNLRITDQRGTVVAAPGSVVTELVSASSESGVAAALLGREGLATRETGGEEVLSAYSPVAGLGWTVTAEVPTAKAFASLAPLRATVLGIAVLLGQVLLAGLVVMARTQRQRRAAERSLVEREETTRGILDAAADAFVSIDTAGIVTSWSTQSESLFGWTAEQACGCPLAELIAPADLQRGLAEALARLRARDGDTQVGQRVELDAADKDGRRFPVEMVLWQSAAGGTVSYNSFIHDISDRKRHEALLAEARDEALEGSRMKTEFLAVMSHELRTPLNGVMGMTSLLLSTPLSAQQRDYAETVRNSADALLGLLNDVLDLSKVEADRVELEELDFDLHPVVRDIVHLLAVSAREKGLELEAGIDADVPLALSGDPARLRQVLLSLVGNAVKFTAAGSVRLRVRSIDSERRDGIWLRFEVTDTGIGIPHEARNRLFQAFSQVDASTTRRYGGTGLGLAISKNLVALFGGEIGVDSEEGVGSTFWFTARFDAAQRLETPVQSTQAYVPKPRTGRQALVLVVDDNATNQKVAVRMLETLGHRADVAASGVEAVEAVSRVPYDLVLMDCRMPLMDGYQATLVIRAGEPAGRRIPIVAMTASAMVADRQRCLEVGMDDYVSKPVRLAEVADKVDRWVAEGAFEQPEPTVTPAVAMAQDAAAVAEHAAVVAEAALGVAQDAAHVAHDAAVIAAEGGGPPALVPAKHEASALVAGSSDPSQGPVLDVDVVEGLRSLGADFLARLVPVFVLAAPDRLADVRAAVEAGDAAVLADAAHALRGSAANLGGLRVAAVCARLEEAALIGDLQAAPADLAQLDRELAAMLLGVSALVTVPA